MKDAGPRGSRLSFAEVSQQHKDESALETVWRGIKGVFGSKETLEDKAREKVVAGLTPEQREQYEKEEESMEAWWVRQATMHSINFKPEPMPDSPMHRHVETQVTEFERSVSQEVLGSSVIRGQ